jgi:hypothetical protein
MQVNWQLKILWMLSSPKPFDGAADFDQGCPESCCDQVRADVADGEPDDGGVG